MEEYLKKLYEQLAQHQNECGNNKQLPILDVLWEYYSRENPMDNHRIKQIEKQLAPAFDALPLEESNNTFSLLYDLVTSYQHAAFIEGIQVGVQIRDLLQKKCTP